MTMLARRNAVATTRCLLALGWAACGLLAGAQDAPRAPFPYVWARAYHVPPETTNQESGYFSLCEGPDGRVYVGTAKYGVNAYLVEFAPPRYAARIVVDTHKVCGLSATGYAAQAKIHTRNFVGPSGRIYIGSKQGYRLDKADKSQYPGGYVMSYDPRTEAARNLGMPYPSEGVIDVVADEARRLLYVVTCEEQHWMLGDLAGEAYRELGPMLAPCATTLVDSRGVASAVTKDFQMAQYDPAADRVSVRPILLDGERFTRAGVASIPTWNLAPDGRTAYLILINDPTLIAIDLLSEGGEVTATRCGVMVEGPRPDSRSALSIGPVGRVYALVRVNNATGFGGGMLHWVARYDPATRRIEQLGVLAVRNPDYFDFQGAKERGTGWVHGFHRLPDGVLTPLHAHMGLVIGKDGTLYATVLYPYTLLVSDQFRAPRWPE